MNPSRCRPRRARTERVLRAIGVGLLSACVITIGCTADEEAAPPAGVTRLQVEYSDTPLGIDVERPRFGWQMRAPEDERGHSQSAYQIVVTDPGAAVMTI